MIRHRTSAGAAQWLQVPDPRGAKEVRGQSDHERPVWVLGPAVAGWLPFGQWSRDLAEPAGPHLTSRRAQRSAEGDGDRVRSAVEGRAGAVLAGKVVPLVRSHPVSNLYVAIDGTGAPTVPAHTAGHRGKSPEGRAHTREAKLGCLFTQGFAAFRTAPQTEYREWGACPEPGDRTGWLTLRAGMAYTGAELWP